LFSVALIVFIALFIRANLPRAYDFQWIVKFGGMLDKSGRRIPGKFNAGEKALFRLVVVLCVVLSVTGYILNFPTSTDARDDAGVQRRAGSSALAIAMDCFHIYLGTVAWPLDAMRTGYVDETWCGTSRILVQ
jgi:formate dehydrogenase subunit gamma